MGARITASVQFNRFAALAQAAEQETAAIVRETAERVELDARVRVPRRTGALFRTIRYRAEGKTGAVVTAGDNKAFYAHMVEFGTVRKAARPFLGPALEAHKQGFLNDLAELEARIK